MTKPNVVFLLTDQWRLQALGYSGNDQVQTPHIDRLSRASINFKHAVAGCMTRKPSAGDRMSPSNPPPGNQPRQRTYSLLR